MSKPNWKFHGITHDDWLIEWFGLWAGRELGDPEQYFTDNPTEILHFIEYCEAEKKPAYMSVAPRVRHSVVYGIDRIFFDFDAKDPKKRPEMELDVLKFISKLRPIIPLIVKTFHGYHVWVFLKKCIQIPHGRTDAGKQLYLALQNLLIKGEEYISLDKNIIGDIKRIARIPISFHEKGVFCEIVDEDLKPIDKIHSLDFFRLYGLTDEDVKQAVKQMELALETEAKEKNKPVLSMGPPPKGQFKIRPCFEYALNSGEMCQQHRLALVIEAVWAGMKPSEIYDLFKKMRDYRQEITEYQVNWQLNKIKHDYLKPYSCCKMISLGWCLKSNNCPIWDRASKR